MKTAFMQNAVLKCIYERRSVRDFKDKPVPKKIVQELLNAAVMAPSARNSQPWHFTIVQDRQTIDRLGEKAMQLQGLFGKFVRAGVKVAGKGTIFYNAPLLIIVSGKSDYDYLKDDVNLAVQNMFLAAHSLGLGSCWIGLAKPLNKDPETLKELGIPKGMEIVAPLIFGYPKKEDKSIPKREPKILKWIE
ncbi:MAG: nitroreductase family protein [Candidatus Diapherotrites archaeon]